MEMETQGKSRRAHKTLLCDYCNELYSVSYRRCPFCKGGENRDGEAKDHTTITKIQDLPDRKSPSIAVTKKLSVDPMPEPISEILAEEVPEERPAPPVKAAIVEKPKTEAKAKQESPVEDFGFSRPEDLLAKLEAVLSADTKSKDSMLEAILAEARGEKSFSYEEEAPSYSQTFEEEEEEAYAPIPPVVPVSVMAEEPEDIEEDAVDEPEEELDAFPENPVDLSVFDAIAAEGKVAFDENEQEIYPNEVQTKGGKRVQAKKGGFSPLRAIRLLISILLIAAAIFIIVTKVLPLVENRLPFFGSDTDSIVQDDTIEEEDVEVLVDTEEEEIVVEIEEIFRLKDTNVTLTAAKETITLEIIFQGAGELGLLTWASSDPSVATVSGGTVTAVGEGDATISATRSDGAVVECSLHCVWSQTEENLNLSLNRDDFTLKSGESFTMEVIGTDSSVTWSIEDSSIATVSDKGVVKYVGSGKTTLTATVAGQTLECIVRCS